MGKFTATKGLVTNILSMTFIQVANNVLPLITVPYIVRIIEPDKFGAINFSAAIITYFTLFINYAFDLTATRRISINKDDLRARSIIFSEVLYAKILLYGISSTVFLVLLYQLPQVANEKQLFIYTFLYCISLIITPNWLFQGLQETYFITIFQFAAKLMFTGLIFFVVQAPEDYIWHPLTYSLSAIVVGAFAFFWSIRNFKIKIQKVTLNSVLKLINVEKTIFYSLVVVNLYSITNLVILGVVQDNHDVAIYSAGWKLIMVAQTIISLPLSLSLFPFIGEHFSISKEQGISVIQKIAPILIFITILSGTILWVLAPWIILTFYGSEFTYSIIVFRILCFIPTISAFNNLLGVQTMVNLSMDRSYLNITLVCTLAGIVFSIILGNQFGFLGAAWAWILKETTSSIVLYSTLKFKYKIKVLRISNFTIHQIKQTTLPVIKSLRLNLHK